MSTLWNFVYRFSWMTTQRTFKVQVTWKFDNPSVLNWIMSANSIERQTRINPLFVHLAGYQVFVVLNLGFSRVYQYHWYVMNRKELNIYSDKISFFDKQKLGNCLNIFQTYWFLYFSLDANSFLFWLVKMPTGLSLVRCY